MPRGQRGKKPNLTVEEGLAASTMVFRKAAANYGVSYHTWKKLREGKGFLPFKGTGLAEDVAASVLESVRQEPHHNTKVRARKLGLGTGAVQAFLQDRGLSNLNGRLGFAGYQVEVCQPLAVARLRRIVASRPGSLTHVDFKTFGFLRGPYGEPAVRLGGFVLIDSLTSFSVVKLAKAGDGFEASAALQQYGQCAPFALEGLVLSDNGGAFLSDGFIGTVRKMGLLLRTIRPSHPWSNGKVEAMNRTLKYQCFAAIAGNVASWEEAVVLVEKWMFYYNHLRSHGGHTNRGLPPVPFYQLWKKTEGDDLQKLISLGIIKLDQEWDVRLMGAQTKQRDESEDTQLPFAFVMDRKQGPSLQVQLGIPAPGIPGNVLGARANNIVLNK
jgi:hypothetical protein